MPDDLIVHNQDELNRVLDNLDTLDPERTIVLARRDPNAIRPESFRIEKAAPNPIRVSKGTMVTAHQPLQSVVVDGGMFDSPNVVQRNVHVEGGRATLPRGSRARAIDGAVHIHGGNVKDDSTEITLRGKAQAITDSGKVFAYDQARVEASGRAHVRAYDHAHIDAFGSATFRADGDTHVRAHDGASGHLHGRSVVDCNDSRVAVTWVSPDAHVNAYDGMKLIVSDDVPPSRLSAALYNAPNADYERVFPFEAKLADTLEIARVSGGNAYHQNLGADAERNSDVRELLESLPDTTEGQQVARAIRDAYAGSFRNQAERAGDTSPEELRDDRHLVYVDGEGNRHYQPVSDVPDAGTLIDPETGDDMELIGWSTSDGGEVSTDDMNLVFIDNDGNIHEQSWRDIDEVGTLIDDNGDDMSFAGSTTDVGTASSNAPACDECGEPFETGDDGTTYHVTSDGDSNPSLDRDHVPYSNGESAVAVPTKGEPSPVTEKVASLPDGTLVKISHKGGEPNTVQTFDQDRRRWGRSMTVAAGQGKAIIEGLSNTPPEDRKVPEATAASYGHATGVCLMCGRALSSASSLLAGYGPECKGKMR